MTRPDELDQVRKRIIQLAREIEEYSQADIPSEQFFQEFLTRVVNAVGARAGAVWMMNGEQQLSLMSAQGLNEIGFAEDQEAQMRNQRLLSEVMTNGQACSYSSDDNTEFPLPTRDLIILAALQKNKQCVGVVEIFQRGDTPAQARAGFLQFVEQMSGYACRFLDRDSASVAADNELQLSGKFEQFLLQIHRSLNIQEVATTVANDGRILLACDRLSVAVKHGKEYRVTAISGQDAVNQRANLVRTMTKMGTKAIAMGDPLIYSGRVENLPPQIEIPLADYIQESGSRMVMVVPLFEPEPLMDAKDKDGSTRKPDEKHKTPIGGLIVEQVSESQPKAGLQHRVELLAEHVGAAVSNARTHQGLFLQPVWRFLGQYTTWLQGRTLVKTVAVIAGLAILGLILAFVPWDYRVEGEGRLMPIVQKNVFCPMDGEVTKIVAESGQRVAEGEVLLQLKNDELHAELLAKRNELNEKKQLRLAIDAQLVEAEKSGVREDVVKLFGQKVETEIQIAGAQKQLSILEEREASLTVRAPIAGVVATFQIEQLLRNRPVRRGEILLEIMDDTGPWRLQLEIEEQRMGHIVNGQQELGTEELPVEFVLATSAESTYNGKLSTLATRSNSSEAAGGSVVEAFVSIDADQLPSRRIGADVTAKINCGKKSLGYVLFGDVVEFLQRYFWL